MEICGTNTMNIASYSSSRIATFSPLRASMSGGMVFVLPATRTYSPRCSRVIRFGRSDHVAEGTRLTGSASVSDDCPADTISSTDWSLIFGLGLEYSRFVFQARYDLGLANVSQGGGDIKNGGWGITLGYGFPIK